MSDFVGGIKQIGPAYPVRPAQPAQKDRETGKRRNPRQKPETENHPERDTEDDEAQRTYDPGDEDGPSGRKIDEHI